MVPTASSFNDTQVTFWSIRLAGPSFWFARSRKEEVFPTSCYPTRMTSRMRIGIREHFGARVWIHEGDCCAAHFATDVLEGDEPREIRPGLLAIPVPGHTRGSVVYLLEEKFLFTGDSLYWSRKRQELTASKSCCWYSWKKQVESLARLANYRFEWVLAGHGDRIRLPHDRTRESLLALTRQYSRV